MTMTKLYNRYWQKPITAVCDCVRTPASFSSLNMSHRSCCNKANINTREKDQDTEALSATGDSEVGKGWISQVSYSTR